MKTNEELTEQREEYEASSNKLKELTGDELNAIGSGHTPPSTGLLCPYADTCTDKYPASCGLQYDFGCPKLY